MYVGTPHLFIPRFLNPKYLLLYSHITLISFLRILRLLFRLSLAQQLGKRIPDASQEQSTEQVLEWYERIMDSKED